MKPLGKDEPITTTRVITYTYDPLNRLTGADYSTGEQFEYAYDAVGNRTVLTTTEGTTTYEYDAANRLTSVDGVTYTWDNRGNLVSDGTFTYTYNSAGRMVRAESVTSTLVYTYNAAGLRVAQSVKSSESVFSWDWAAGVPELLVQSPNPQSPNQRSLFLVGHDTLGVWNGTAWAYHLPDALGSVRQVVDGAGAVVSAREWTPYGVEVGAAQSGLGYTGEWQDLNLGMMYLRARWYDGQTSRFSTEDSLPGTVFLPPTQHAYAYVANNPIRYTDPTGNLRRDEFPEAERIMRQLRNRFNVQIVKDWGEWSYPTPSYYTQGLPPGSLCGWFPGRWTLIEIRMVRFAVAKMAAAMGEETDFRNFIGFREISKTPFACGRGCTRPSSRRTEMLDRGLPPAPGTRLSEMIVNGDVDFDAWSVVHELGHVWDINNNWGLSKGLEEYTGGSTSGRMDPILFLHCDIDNWRPGCNTAGYFYGGIPPKGSDANFNRKEDFAESVAAYVFPDEAQQWVERWHGTLYEELLWYSDYRETIRWQYVNGLIDGTITVP